MNIFKDLKVGIIVGVFMLFWWGRGWLRLIPGLLFGLLCRLCRDEVLRREAERIEGNQTQRGTGE